DAGTVELDEEMVVACVTPREQPRRKRPPTVPKQIAPAPQREAERRRLRIGSEREPRNIYALQQPPQVARQRKRRELPVERRPGRRIIRPLRNLEAKRRQRLAQPIDA